MYGVFAAHFRANSRSRRPPTPAILRPIGSAVVQVGAIRMARYSRRGGRHRRAAGKGRAVRGYTIRDRKGRIKYVGVSNNPGRRAAEHKRDGKRGKLKVEPRPVSRAYARRWEAQKLARHRKTHRGKNPAHNKTRSGGWNQLVRARGSHPRGPGFESLRAH